MIKTKTKVAKCDLNGNVVKTFNTQVDAAIDANVHKKTMGKYCKNKDIALNGYKYYIFEIKFEVPDEVDETIKNFKCPYCDKKFPTYNGICKHVIKAKSHGDISKEKLLADYKYNGKRPLCACGCGKETKIMYAHDIHFGDFLQGHYSRVHNNWGNNENAMKNSAETRRKRFKSGEIITWNKGKTWKETYTKEQIESLNLMYNKERNKKISDKLKNVPKSKEHTEKNRKIKRDPIARSKQSKVMHDRIANGSFSPSSKEEKDFAVKYLDPLNIKYQTQKYIKEIEQYCDFYFESLNLYIEFDGDFWHSNPIKYPNGPVYKYQINKVEKDRIKNEWCKKNGIKLIRIWENDFKKNPEIVLDKLKFLTENHETAIEK
jgi:very-short-patch-repair endonuclease